MVPQLYTSFTEGQGPCSAFDKHYRLNIIERAIKKHQKRKTSVKLTESSREYKSLLWLANESSPEGLDNIDCTRFVLRAKKLLWDGPVEFYRPYQLYWQACGNIIGVLASREGRTPAAISSMEMLNDLERRFCDSGEDAWAPRQFIILCVAKMVRKFPQSARSVPQVWDNSTFSQFMRFWDVLDCYRAHVDAALDCLSALPYPETLPAAARELLDLWSVLCQILEDFPSPAPTDILGRLLDEAGPLYQIIKRLNLSTKQTDKWGETMGCLLSHISKTSWSLAYEQKYNELAKLISSEERTQQAPRVLPSAGLAIRASSNDWDKIPEEIQEAWREFIKGLPNADGLNGPVDLLALLQRVRGMRPPRKVPHPEKQFCDVELRMMDDSQRLYPARFLNICPVSYRGFAIEIKDVGTNGVWEKDRGILPAESVDSYACRWIELRLPDGSTVRVKDATIRIKNDEFVFDLHCHIVRAWELGGSTTSGSKST